MSRRAAVRQIVVTRAFRGALAAGMPVGSFEIIVENDRVRILPIAANAPTDDADDMERRMKDAFGE